MRSYLLVLMGVVWMAAGCAATPVGEPSPVPTPAPAVVERPADLPRRARLPDPPAPVPTSGQARPSQPATGSTVPPPGPAPATPTSPPVQAATIPLAFHLQVSEQESIPAARGLVDRLVVPSGLPIVKGAVEIVYEWRPEDGKEHRLNPRTQKPYGPIWRATLAEQMEPENLSRHLNTMGPWLDAYVPRGFAGVVCLDVERWPLKGDEFHMSKPFKDDLARRAPGKKQSELMAEFIRVTQERAKELRPGVTGWGWWAMGGMNPGWPAWRKDQYTQWKQHDEAADARALARVQVPMPSFYYPAALGTEAERMAAWEKVKENWVSMYGRERLGRDGYAYVNITHDVGPRKGQSLTRSEFHECVEQARSVGMRRFVVWDFMDGPARFARVQKFVDEVLVPEVRAQVAAEAKAKPTAAPEGSRQVPGAERTDTTRRD